MKELQRLLAGPELNAEEANLLRIARSEGPSELSRARILSSLSANAAAGPAAAPPGHQLGSAKATAAGTWKWTLGGFMAVAVAVPAVVLLGRGEKTEASPKPAPTLRLEPSAAQREPERTSGEVVQAPVELPPPASSSRPRVTAPRAASASLREELAAIRTARAQLAAGDSQAALQSLDDYNRRYPKGRLMPEATVLRVEALVKRGDLVRARAVARPLLVRSSPYAARVSKLLGKPAP